MEIDNVNAKMRKINDGLKYSRAVYENKPIVENYHKIGIENLKPDELHSYKTCYAKFMAGKDFMSKNWDMYDGKTYGDLKEQFEHLMQLKKIYSFDLQKILLNFKISMSR